MSFQKVTTLSRWAAKEAEDRVTVVCLSRTVGVSGNTPLSCQVTTSAPLPRAPPAHTKGWMCHQPPVRCPSISRANATSWWPPVVIGPCDIDRADSDSSLWHGNSTFPARRNKAGKTPTTDDNAERESNANAAVIQDYRRIKAVDPTCCPISNISVVLAACICMFEGWILEVLVQLTEGSISHCCN